MDKTDDASQVLATVKQKNGEKQNLPSIEQFCDRWEKGDHLELWAVVKKTAEKAKPLKPKQTNDQQQQDSQLDAAASDGQYCRACRVLTSSGIALNTVESWKLFFFWI